MPAAAGHVSARGAHGGSRAAAAAAALAAAVALALAGCGSPLTVTAAAASKLSAVAASTAKSNGGHRFATASAVATTESGAVRALGPLTSGPVRHVTGSTGVYLVTMTGRFIVFEPLEAGGAHFGVGRSLSLIVEPGSFRVLGYKINTTAPRVSPARLGKVTRLKAAG